MNSNRVRFFLVVLYFVTSTFTGAELQAAEHPPNIVVILTDDQGYADISLNPLHANSVSTPQMDALARDGVLFSQGYTSGHVCSPTRAGIMIGGYSQRVGVYGAGDGGRGFDPQKKIFPGFLPDEYVCSAIGKWHLGLDNDFPELKWHAMNRGFDECYKFMGRGGHSYFDLRRDSDGRFSGPIYRNKQRINDSGYLTNRLTEEAVAFIDRNRENPFFLYLAYNAVHSPAEAPADDIAFFRTKFPEISEERAILMAMLKHLDDGVGEVVKKLKDDGLFENTLLFFLTDNGGSQAMSADNSPLRGFKQSLDEGGIRTPLIVSWPQRFVGGRTIDTPVISFDILPTVLDAIGQFPPTNDFDGKSLLPLLEGAKQSHHETLFWSKGKEEEWAVRRGDWKLHRKKQAVELINLSNDVSEANNLAEQHPGKVKELAGAYDSWIAEMAEPITGGGKGPTVNTNITSASAELDERRVQVSESSAVDSRTLLGKVMCGYQGWFNCPADGANLGWTHWWRDRGREFGPDNVSVDLWPDMSEMDADERYETTFRHQDGRVAEVFSSANPKTVARHFKWMREYGIDGVFLQRFANGLRRPDQKRHKDKVLQHVRTSSIENGRTYALMYDLSGLGQGGVDSVRQDWLSLRGKYQLTADKSYQAHNGKPVVAIWGIGFLDGGKPRRYTLSECRELVQFLKDDGCTVMLGVPTGWRELHRDSVQDHELHDIIKLADLVSPWTVGRYRDEASVARHADKYWSIDKSWCDENRLDYMPVVFPGFSWHNLKGEPLGAIPRNRGEFLWSQIAAAKRVGCEMLYVAMFDEVDEGTAIFKCTNDPPNGNGAQFLEYEGLPSDHYLRLVGRAARLMRGESTLHKDESSRER
tara:strand:+ start:83282 stop:85888 length:2607 start_codon:yes stop_codon:yes gene_type:complete